MLMLRRLAGLLSLAAALSACPSDDTSSETETGSETSSATETTDTDPSSTETGDNCSPPGEFGDCGMGGDAACMSAGGPSQCVLDDPGAPSIAVCGRPCTEVCECWAAPASGDAPVACVSLAPGDDGTCILDCTNDEACPDDMQCSQLPTGTKLCVFTQ